MRQIFPVTGPDLALPPAITAGPLPPVVTELARLYGNVAVPGDGRSPSWWLRANMVASTDGAVSVGGRSGGLSGPGDRALFGVLRSLADVILVGSSTARAERYRPATEAGLWLQLRDGRPPPPVAIVSPSLNLDGLDRLLDGAGSAATTIVLTTRDAHARAGASLAGRAHVIEAGAHDFDLRAALAALAGLGLTSVLCEGGPTLLGLLTAAGLLDELCVTTSPVIAAGQAGRIVSSPADAAAGPVGLDLAHVLADGSFMFSRYRRAAPAPAG